MLHPPPGYQAMAQKIVKYLTEWRIDHRLVTPMGFRCCTKAIPIGFIEPEMSIALYVQPQASRRHIEHIQRPADTTSIFLIQKATGLWIYGNRSRYVKVFPGSAWTESGFANLPWIVLYVQESILSMPYEHILRNLDPLAFFLYREPIYLF